MKVAELKRILNKEKDNIDVVVIINKKDIEKINLIGKNTANHLVLNVNVGEKVVENELPLIVTGGTVPYDQFKKLTEEEILKSES